MKTSLTYKAVSDHPIITIPGSKSESNRLLILKGCYPNISITNLSNSDDTISLLKGIEQVDGVVDIHHAGTAMRFLTAYFASKKGVDIIRQVDNTPRFKESFGHCQMVNQSIGAKCRSQCETQCQQNKNG